MDRTQACAFLRSPGPPPRPHCNDAFKRQELTKVGENKREDSSVSGQQESEWVRADRRDPDSTLTLPRGKRNTTLACLESPCLAREVAPWAPLPASAFPPLSLWALPVCAPCRTGRGLASLGGSRGCLGAERARGRERSVAVYLLGALGPEAPSSPPPCSAGLPLHAGDSRSSQSNPTSPTREKPGNAGASRSARGPHLPGRTEAQLPTSLSTGGLRPGSHGSALKGVQTTKAF